MIPLWGLAVYGAVILLVGLVVGGYASHQHRKYAALAEAERGEERLIAERNQHPISPVD